MAQFEKRFDLEQRLANIYYDYGLPKFLDVCAALLKIKDNDHTDKKMQMNGAVCEVVLRVLTENYLKETNRKGYIYQSLILDNPSNPESDFCTELDFLLLTPYFCATGECKSFVGHINITEDCTLQRENIVADVARQSRVHLNALSPYLRSCVVSNVANRSKVANTTLKAVTRPNIKVGLFCFLYSYGSIKDLRTKQNQKIFPVLTPDTLKNYYDTLFRLHREEIYDVEKAAKIFQKKANSSSLHTKHANYIGY